MIGDWKKIKNKKYMRITTVKGDIYKARRYLRDYYGVFSKKTFVSNNTSLNQLHKKGQVDIRMKKNKVKNGFDIYISPKKNTKFAFIHPVIMGSRKGDGWL